MKAVKFTFDDAFDGTVSRSNRDAEQRLEAERAKAFEQGRGQGQDDALKQLEANISASLESLSAAIGQLSQQHAANTETARKEAGRLAFVIASKLAPALIKRCPTGEIEALIVECLELSEKEPRLVVRVAEGLFEPLKERVEPLKANAGFPGQIVLIGDNDITPGDCRVEWADGGAERDYAAVVLKIEQAIERFVACSPAPDDPQDRIEAAAGPSENLTSGDAPEPGSGDPYPTENSDVR